MDPSPFRRRIVVLLDNEPQLWTKWLVATLAERSDLDLVCMAGESPDPASRRQFSRMTAFFISRLRATQVPVLEALFDGAATRRWWARPDSVIRGFPAVDRRCRAESALPAPGGEILSLTSRPTAAHGVNTDIVTVRVGGCVIDQALDAVVLGIADREPGRFNATIDVHHANGLRTIKVVEPQVAPGETGEQILLKVLSELAAALWSVPESDAVATPNERRLAPAGPLSIGVWLRYRLSGRGRRSACTYETALA